jgi:hypothetical protein
MIDNPILKRREDESLKQYEIRICSNKDRYDLSWDHVAEVLNHERGESWGESKYRKWWYAFQDGLEFSKQQNIESEEVLNELEMKKIELIEERKKLQTIRSQYNKIATQQGRKDLLFEQLRDGFQSLEVIDPHIDLSAKFNLEQANVLSFGDIHFGKQFTSFSNEYSEEIAINRMNKIIEDTVKYLHKNDIVDLDVINLADSIEGMTLRTSQLQSLQSGFTDQVIKFSKYYAKWIRELSKYANLNVHHLTSSNHTELRPHNSSRGEYPAEDMERIIGMYIQDVLEGHENIDINLYDNGIADFKLLDYNIIALHGHQLKNKKNVIKDLSLHRRKFYDFAFLGHYHHTDISTVGEGSTNNMQTIQVPSVMGSDEYSDSFFAGSKAGALITTFTKEKGLTDTHHIILN